MKQLILLATFCIGIYANHISWQSNFDKAHQRAIKEKKKLMVLLIEKNSKVSIDTIKTTFINQPYIDKINSEYISVLVTKSQKSSYPIEMLYTLTYPSLFFLDNHELFVCKPIRGEVTPNRLKSHLEKCR